MGLFNKKNTAAPADTTAATGTHHREKKASKPGREHGGARSWNSRPTFGQWIKATWLDILTMAIMGAIGLGVYMADPAPSRSFPVTFRDGEVVYPEFAYPLRNEIIPIWAAALMAFFIPFVVFLFCQIRVRSFWDVNNATIGLLYSLIVAAVFQVFVKWLIGGTSYQYVISKANTNPSRFPPSLPCRMQACHPSQPELRHRCHQ